MMQGWDYFLLPQANADMMPPDGAMLVRQMGNWALYQNLLKSR